MRICIDPRLSNYRVSRIVSRILTRVFFPRAFVGDYLSEDIEMTENNDVSYLLFFFLFFRRDFAYLRRKIALNERHYLCGGK